VPTLAPLFGTLLVLIVAFLLLTWISSPLFNLLLRLNRFGRLALSRAERIESTWIGACFVPAAVCFVAELVHSTLLTRFGMMYFGLLLFPLAVTFRQPEGTPRRLMAAYTGVLALLGLPVLSLIVFGSASPWTDVASAVTLFGYFQTGAILSTWIRALFRLQPTA
jgi:hypothetical protein